MPAMSEKRGSQHYYRTLPAYRGFFARLMGNLRATVRFAGRSGYLSNDAILNASWAWMVEMDPEALAESLEPHIARFEDAWKEAKPVAGGEKPMTKGRKVVKKRKRNKKGA